MLAGIKTGKKKKKKEEQEHGEKDPPAPPVSATAGGGEKRKARTFAPPSQSKSAAMNSLIAEQLRQQLSSGRAPEKADTDTTVIAPVAEGFRPVMGGSEGAPKKDPSAWTVQEMMSYEKSQKGQSLSEQEARNVLRYNKKRRLKKNMDSDDEEELQMRHVSQEGEERVGSGGTGAAAGKASEKAARRFQHRQLAAHDRQQQVISKCWWCIEAGDAFSSHLLISNGQHVTFMMAPANLSLVESKHFYLVPIQHAESLAGCDEGTVWKEIRQYLSGLRDMFRNKGDKYRLISFETVLSSSSSSIWQTRLEVVAVPKKYWHDAPFFFKSALEEAAQEWGTHQKLMKTSAEKPLARTVPGNFDYFYVEYDSEKRLGFVQMIENSTATTASKRISKDFGADTIAGMMGADTIRFKRKQKTDIASETDAVQKFQSKWTTSIKTPGTS